MNLLRFLPPRNAKGPASAGPSFLDLRAIRGFQAVACPARDNRRLRE